MAAYVMARCVTYGRIRITYQYMHSPGTSRQVCVICTQLEQTCRFMSYALIRKQQVCLCHMHLLEISRQVCVICTQLETTGMFVSYALTWNKQVILYHVHSPGTSHMHSPRTRRQVCVTYADLTATIRCMFNSLNIFISLSIIYLKLIHGSNRRCTKSRTVLYKTFKNP